MTVTSSYGVEIRKMNICFRKTLEYYRGAVAWLITAYESVWEELKQIPSRLPPRSVLTGVHRTPAPHLTVREADTGLAARSDSGLPVTFDCGGAHGPSYKTEHGLFPL